MNTFLPYPSFSRSVKALDYRRLGKQRVEAKQILNALRGESKGWRNHPATRMWEGYEHALTLYMNHCITEWVSRGFRNTMEIRAVPADFKCPKWFGDSSLHLTHQSNLIRKDPEFYRPIFGDDVPDDLDYFWPSKDDTWMNPEVKITSTKKAKDSDNRQYTMETPSKSERTWRNIMIEVNPDKRIVAAVCDCPAFTFKRKNCKHLDACIEHLKRIKALS